MHLSLQPRPPILPAHSSLSFLPSPQHHPPPTVTFTRLCAHQSPFCFLPSSFLLEESPALYPTPCPCSPTDCSRGGCPVADGHRTLRDPIFTRASAADLVLFHQAPVLQGDQRLPPVPYTSLKHHLHHFSSQCISLLPLPLRKPRHSENTKRPCPHPPGSPC